ncbi:glucans biosynthesis glucosyltransferase MdoH [Thioalkalivibrio sp. XN8]|uniref:glucans biosynthesis glucosyltransferase MdoH n=1 Tax=Thioalkalivibrio sp. XN8 TaxID=2712863 RepID=UPI0013EC478C|nr:glucans biosynthesis glucosyltransferase MdoH [Thioalkalivibrio sp. XN8]NGP54509.1 glucans biosynthesis glucosyltransferase MdoH [Thioalkalivibrio sp. XN8]
MTSELSAARAHAARRALPAESPLAMPRRSLHEPRQPLRARVSWGARLRIILARVYVLGSTLALAGYGTREMYGVLSTISITPLQWVFLGLFSINFTWISFAFALATLGFVRSLLPRLWRVPEHQGELPFRTAILLPVYNESPQRIAAAIIAMRAELAEREPGKYAFFILSDTNQADAWVAEEAVFREVVVPEDAACPVFYRRRADNRERKAGNIADWVRRWGGDYEAMIVLDADSIISPGTLVKLSRRLAAAPGIGLIQTLPRIVRARSLYGRAQQFANQCYGPIYAGGLAAWHGLSSNFWGHNAIIRTRAFAGSCSLPLLKGRPPLGGAVLSHDFIEAALLRRAGWGVRFDVDLQQSWEEAPPSLVDVLVRDRRWCQGNLQHSRFLFARGLTLTSRLHLLTGIMAYASAALWLLLALVGLLIAVQAKFVRPEYFAEPSLFPTWPVFDAERALQLFVISMAVVVAPKVLGWFSALARIPLSLRFGGPILLTLSTVFEALLSALYAPILMFAQAHVIWAVLRGSDTGWKTQRRDDGALGWGAALRAHRGQVLVGATLALIAWSVDEYLFYWLLPITLGLVLAVPLSWVSGGAGRGRIFARLGLLRAPEEKQPAPVLARLQDELGAMPDPGEEPALRRLARDRGLLAWHRAQLASTPARPALADFNAPAVTAGWKAEHAATLDELGHWLNPAETLALINRPSGLEQIQQLGDRQLSMVTPGQ